MATSTDRKQVQWLLETEEAQIVDVLPRSEYDESHIPGAFNIPLKRLTADAVAGLTRDKPVVVYCHDGL